MQLGEYFKQQKQSYISDTDKLNLYQNFLIKDMKGHFQRKRSILHVKSFVYSMLIFVMIFGFYGVYFFNDRYSNYEGLLTNGENTAQADFIAKVVDFNGSFYIEHLGKRVSTSNIQDGDVVTLQDNASLVFHINTDTQAKLIGPAQFSILKIANPDKTKKDIQYKLNVLYGDFVEVQSLKDKSSDHVQLTVEDLISVQQTNGKSSNYQLIKQGNRRIIKNNGGSLLVTTFDENKKEIKTNIAAQQVLAIQKNDITVFDNMEKFTKAIKSNDISQTFTFNIFKADSKDSEGQSGTQDIKEVELNTLLTTKDQEVDQEVSKSLGGLLSDSKKVIGPDQSQAMASALYKDFVLQDMKGIYTNILQGDDKGFQTSFTTLETRIRQLYTSFGLKYEPTKAGNIKDSLAGLKKSIVTFVSSVRDNYMIPPKYFNSLSTISNRLEYLAGQSYGSSKKADENWQNLLNTLPGKLRF